LKESIARDMQAFRAETGVDENDGTEASIADVFGLVYAAGLMAQQYGALPKSLDCDEAALAVYRLNRATSAPPPSHLSRLQNIVGRAVRVDPSDLPEMTDEEFAAAPAFLRVNRSGEAELLITPKAWKRAFPVTTLGEFFRDPDVALAHRSGKDDRLDVKRTVRVKERQERFYCFVLDEDTGEN
jgi:hypothetical protein